ncbi:MAG: ELM1/GtrOC1 family putative glycosyltransferase [Haliea sp.]|uniref:ELM1/GtrOC1 family putative glycosyltransferase n=1 Tax=Haliea sp. TaxID=1932666 RepID=UPI0032EC5022
MTTVRDALVIWCVEDDRPGHRRQLAGLAAALQALRHVRICRIGRGESAALLPAPDLILTAGRESHWRGLRYRWHYGGKLVALMDPGLPRTLFDLSVIPEHDGIGASDKVLLSAGPLNPVKPASAPDRNKGLRLVGGPSRHYRWSDTDLAAQMQRLQAALPELMWTLTTSPRTPASFSRRVRQLANPGLQVVALEETNPDWLLRQYAHCGVIWVSEDSASMVYESLSCGAAVGILSVPLRRHGRVSKGVQRLLERGQLLRLQDLETLGKMPLPQPPLQEATRIAQTISHWLN